MEIKVDNQGEVVRVSPVGNIDELGADDLKDCLMRLNPADAGQVVIDFSGVTYIGSAGIGKLLLFYKKTAASETKIILQNLSPDIYDNFKSVKLDQIFDLNK